VPFQFAVTYRDDVAVNAGTLGNGNLMVTGPGGYSEAATLVSMGLLDSRSVSAVYSIPAPTTDGSYTVSTGLSLVMDVDSNAMAPGVVGAFPVQIMVPRRMGPTSPPHSWASHRLRSSQEQVAACG